MPALAVLAICSATFAIYAPARHFHFVNFDDDQYVYNNPSVQKGLTLESVRWALTTGYFGLWFPVTWFSYLTEITLFGVDPAAMHRTSLGLHLLNVVLLIGALARLGVTPATAWLSGAIFALHPASVESAVWISARKDVLSASLGFMALIAYAGIVGPRPRRAWLGAALFFTLGLLAKPMLVPLPVALLAFDYWPLERKEALTRWIAEKSPLMAISVVIAALAYATQHALGALPDLEVIPLWTRVANSLTAPWAYLQGLFWPTRFCVFYPSPMSERSLLIVLASAVGLGVVTSALWWLRRRWPAGWVGWVFFLVMFAPLSGIVPIGGHWLADRYLYVPSVGIYLLVADASRRAIQSARSPVLRYAGCAAALLALGGLSYLTRQQVMTWRSSVALMTHALGSASESRLVHNNLGQALMSERRFDEARGHLEAAVRIDPNSYRALNNLGMAQFELGHTDDALANFRRSIELNPQYAQAHVNLGNALLKLDRPLEALSCFEAALLAEPNHPDAHHNLGLLRAGMRQFTEAEYHLRKALQLKPQSLDTVVLLADNLLEQGRHDEALHVIEDAGAVDDPNGELAGERLWIVAVDQESSVERRQQASMDADRLVSEHPSNARLWDIRAACQASLGKYSDAAQSAAKAVELATRDDPHLIDELRRRRVLYQRGRPFVIPRATQAR